MHRYAIVLLAALMSGGVSFAQNQAASSDAARQEAGPDSSQASGHQTMAIELSKSLDAKKLKQGDVVKAKITSVFRLENGKSIPIGSTVLGHVTQAALRSKGMKESSLGIAFDSVMLKDGSQIPLKSVIQAVAAPPEWPIANPGNGNQGMGQPPVMGPGTPANPSGVPYPGTGTSPVGGYPPVPPSSTQPPAGQPDTGNSPELTPQSTGVFGMRNVSLQSDSTLISTDKDLKLEAGTTMILRVQNQ